MVMHLTLNQTYPSSILGRPTYSVVTRVVMACTVNALFVGSTPTNGAEWDANFDGEALPLKQNKLSSNLRRPTCGLLHK